MDDTQKTMQKSFLEAPADIQKLLQSPEAAATVMNIAERHQVSDQIDLLVNEVVYLMTGLEHPEDFAWSLSTHLEISEEKARSIAAELNAQLFHAVRESLKKVHHLGKYAEKDLEDDAEEETVIRPAPMTTAAPASTSLPRSSIAMPSALTPTPSAPAAPDLLKQKLGGFFVMPQPQKPSEARPVPPPASKPAAPVASAPAPSAKPAATIPPGAIPAAAKTDLYREPVAASSAPATPTAPSMPAASPAASVPTAGTAPQLKRMIDPYREPIDNL